MLLEVKNLSLTLSDKFQKKTLLKSTNLVLEEESKTAIVGMSGSGKTLFVRALLGLLPYNIVMNAETEIRLRGEAILQNLQYTPSQKHKMSLILQDPHSSLNPKLTVGEQLKEVLPPKTTVSEEKKALQDMMSAMHMTEGVLRKYPHELSGGMAQRVMVCMMTWLEPCLLVADEPTSSLDAPIGVSVMELMIKKTAEKQSSLLLISHDINMVRRFCDRIIVFYQGELVEDLKKDELHTAKHFHTKSLLNALCPSGDENE